MRSSTMQRSKTVWCSAFGLIAVVVTIAVCIVLNDWVKSFLYYLNN